MPSRDDIHAAINRVVDPCSNAMGVPLGLLEMGLASITRIDEAVGEVNVTMCVTSPCCAYAPTMAAAVETEVMSLDWVRAVRVTIDPTVTWTEAMMSATARDALALRRARTVALADVRPFAWNERSPK